MGRFLLGETGPGGGPPAHQAGVEQVGRPAEMIASYNEGHPANEDKIGPWMAQRHGVPDGYTYVNHQPWHFLFSGSPEAVKASFNDGLAPGHPDRSDLRPIEGKKNHYELVREK
jgi:hypothetical protein